jgi:hypothetical protein
MPVYVAAAGAGEAHARVEERIRQSPGLRVHWLDRESGLWLAVFPDHAPDPGEHFRTLNALDRDRIGPGSAGFIVELVASLRSEVA